MALIKTSNPALSGDTFRVGGAALGDKTRPAIPHIQGFSTVPRKRRHRASTGASAKAAS